MHDAIVALSKLSITPALLFAAVEASALTTQGDCDKHLLNAHHAILTTVWWWSGATWWCAGGE